MTQSDYFTVIELAKEFRVNPKTIYRRLWAKGIPAYKRRLVLRIARKDIKWLRQWWPYKTSEVGFTWLGRLFYESIWLN